MKDSRTDISKTNLEEIFYLIKKKTGHDFTRYKRHTMCRRIERRLMMLHVPDMNHYLKLLKREPEEINKLCKELLVSVTGFFRDQEIFEYIEGVLIEEIFARVSNNRLRIWVPACASGEEAYSWGILFKDYIEKHEIACDLQIFASDIDRVALNKAREGYYSKESIQYLSEEIIAKYFTPEGEGYRVNRSMREIILFAEQNLISDPPYSRMDLISCRNLLIYMDISLQQQAITIFNYALQTGGYLVLGNAETLGANAKYFKVSNRKYKVFQKLITKSVSGKIWNIQHRDNRYQLSDEGADSHPSLKEIAQRIVLDRFTPLGLMIDHQGNILYVQGRTGRFLEITTGEASHDLLQIVRDGLKIALANGIRKVKKSGEEVVIENLWVKGEGGDEAINLILSPIIINNANSHLIFIVFQPVLKSLSDEHASVAYENDYILELERELQDSQEFLQNTIEEIESANEVGRSTNEELQSTNEELITVNSELQHKIEELSNLNNDMKNLLASTQIATIFLDKELKIFRFTPSISQIIDLLESDIGRSINQFTNTLNYTSLSEDLQNVLNTLIPKEIEVETIDHRFFWMRMLPYRTIDDRVKGIVITFTDISEKRAQEQEIEQYQNHLEALIKVKTDEIRQNEEKFTTIFNHMINGFAYHKLVTDNNGNPVDYIFLEINRSFERLVSITREQLIGKTVTSAIPGIQYDSANWINIYGTVALTGENITFEQYSEEIKKWFFITAYSPKLGYFATIFEDITPRKEAEIQLKEREHFQKTLLDTTSDIIYIYDIKKQENIYSNKGVMETLGYRQEDVVVFGDKFLKNVMHPEDFQRYTTQIVPKYQQLSDDEFIEHEYRVEDKSGVWHWLSSLEKVFHRDDTGEVIEVFGSTRDITQRKRVEEGMIEHQRLNAIGEMAAAVAHDFNNALQAIIGSVDLAQMSIGDSRKLDRYLATIKTVSGDIALRVQLLQRFGGSKPEGTVQHPINLNDVIADAIISSRPIWKDQMELRGVVATIKPLYRVLPNISGNASELRTVIYNMIKNSIEAMPRGGEISLETKVLNSIVYLTVTDTGQGMDQDSLKRAFQPFYSTRGFEMGRGLGLSNAYSIVREHQGSIAVKESILDKGTTIELKFPAITEEKVKSLHNNQQRDQKNRDHYRVLWVDDDDVIRAIAFEMLEMLEYRCDVVSGGDEALKMLETTSYDLIITDIGMPYMNGWQLTEEIRKRFGCDQKVVIVTGWGDQVDSIQKKEYHIDDVLGKPLMIEQIKKLLERILG